MSNDTQDPTIDRRRGDAASDGDLPEGMQVGEYRVMRKIGEGGMGAVYSAVQPIIGKRVAIKVLAPHIAQNPELVRRFVDEARAVNKIGHPNIVDIFSFGRLPDRRHYFAMEFLDGESLAERMKRGAIPAAERRRLLRQICQALEAAHRQRIVHRDLKPDNIWVVKPQHGDTFAKLLDFGIAKLMGDADGGEALQDKSKRTQTGVVMGTPAYMSPEQCRGVAVDHRTDIYALGMIVYEMFAGRLPFDGSFAELLTHHLISVPELLSRHARVPPALDQLVQSCLEKDPAHRPKSAEALELALEAALPHDDDDPAAVGTGAASQSAPVAPPPAAAAPAPEHPDTLAPQMGHTVPPHPTELPARDRTPWAVAAVVLGLGVIVAVVLSVRRPHVAAGPVAADASLAPTIRPPSPAPVAEPVPSGSAHIVIEDANAARLLVDGKVVATGAREVRISRLTADQPHQLRVEGPAFRQPYDRSFTVAAGAEVELSVAPAPPPSSSAKTRPHPLRQRENAPSEPSSAGPHHRDGLVGDDIFNAKP